MPLHTSSSPYPIISIIDFHHARGPEVEHWIGLTSPSDISEWPNLPFLALADGAHSSTEDFSFFTLRHNPQPQAEDSGSAPAEGVEEIQRRKPPTTLFGISCTRQLDSRQLIDRPADVTRSTVQKAVVVIAESPTFFFGHLKQQLSAVTQAWFAQRDFGDLDIIRRFQESLQISMDQHDKEREQYVGLSLREIVHEFKYQTLVLFKCMLLQPKMLFFSQRCEQLCMMQFSLLSLIPGLMRALQDCSDPELNEYEKNLKKPTSVKTSDRKSLLAFMGLPLQIFGKGSLFGPYTPLQQLDVLADVGTKSYMVGSTNSLLLQQRDRYSDILINLDDRSVNITSTSLRAALALTAADRRFIDHLVQDVVESWDDADPSRPKTMGFVGSEDYIRLQFEEYVLSMVSSVKYHLFLEKHTGSPANLLPDIEGDPSLDFSSEFIDYWLKTDNFRIFQTCTESEIFDIVPPRHVMAGGLSMEDVQRRIAQSGSSSSTISSTPAPAKLTSSLWGRQVSELHLDEKVTASKEAAAKAIAAGRNNLSMAFMNINKNIESFRERRRLQQEQEALNQTAQPAAATATPSGIAENTPLPESKPSTVPSSPTIEAPVTIQQQPSKAGAYMSSWAAWAAEKRKAFASPPASEAGGPAPTASNRNSTSTIAATFDGSAENKLAPAPVAPAKPGLFSRWSKGSVDLKTPPAEKKEKEATRGIETEELERVKSNETVFDRDGEVEEEVRGRTRKRRGESKVDAAMLGALVGVDAHEEEEGEKDVVGEKEDKLLQAVEKVSPVPMPQVEKKEVMEAPQAVEEKEVMEAPQTVEEKVMEAPQTVEEKEVMEAPQTVEEKEVMEAPQTVEERETELRPVSIASLMPQEVPLMSKPQPKEEVYSSESEEEKEFVPVPAPKTVDSAPAPVPMGPASPPPPSSRSPSPSPRSPAPETIPEPVINRSPSPPPPPRSPSLPPRSLTPEAAPEPVFTRAASPPPPFPRSSSPPRRSPTPEAASTPTVTKAASPPSSPPRSPSSPRSPMLEAAPAPVFTRIASPPPPPRSPSPERIRAVSPPPARRSSTPEPTPAPISVPVSPPRQPSRTPSPTTVPAPISSVRASINRFSGSFPAQRTPSIASSSIHSPSPPHSPTVASPTGSTGPGATSAIPGVFVKPTLRKKNPLAEKFERAAKEEDERAAEGSPKTEREKRSSLNPAPKRGEVKIGGLAARRALFEGK